MLRAFFIFLFSTGFFVGAYSQKKSCISADLHYGFLMPHHEFMRLYLEKHVQMVALSISTYNDTCSYWQKLHDFPQYGFWIAYSSLSSYNFLGEALAINPFIDFAIIQKKNYNLSYRLSGGIAYLTKAFSPTENYKNVAIGTKINACLNTHLCFSQKINDNLNLRAGLALTHFSNGKIKVPNLGINNVTVFSSIEYVINRKNSNCLKDRKDFFIKNKYERNIFWGNAIKQIYPPGGKYYYSTSLSTNIKKNIKNKRKLGVGLDCFYDFSDVAYSKRFENNISPVKFIKPGIYLISDLCLNRTTIFFHLGHYIYAYKKNYDVGMLYDRVGTQFYLNKTFSLQIALKTHYAKADMIEFSLNYSF